MQGLGGWYTSPALYPLKEKEKVAVCFIKETGHAEHTKKEKQFYSKRVRESGFFFQAWNIGGVDCTKIENLSFIGSKTETIGPAPGHVKTMR